MKEHIIWSNINLNIEDWRKELESEYPNISEEEMFEKMIEINDSYLEDERLNLNVNVGKTIIIIADLGLWNGRHYGYREIKSGMISDCLYMSHDYAKWYVDEKKDFRCIDIHHDGTNRLLYRKYKENVSEEDIEKLKLKILAGTFTDWDVEVLTDPIGDVISDMHGWIEN